jgi:NAD(P)-dependent dehydrogenase (short-subunit alcohol dehydrogenase family)
MKLAGKKALITGGNSGIGLATARLFISEGAEVAISGRDQQTPDEAVAELGSKAHGYRADVTVAEDRKRLFAELAKDFGKLDIVFANAGISGRTPTGTTDEAIFEKIVHTNLNGAFFTVNSAAPLMNDNGSIIFNGSVHNYLGQPGLAAYAATKGGLVSMARSIAADLAPRKIRVNVVAPGATKTPIWKCGVRANATAEESAKVSDFFSSTVPLARWGEPEDLAKAVLLSCLGRFVVHQRGGADGGWRTDGRSLRSPHSSRLTVENSYEARTAGLYKAWVFTLRWNLKSAA